MQTGDMPPEESAPNPDAVISGTPRFKLWALEDLGDGVSAGIWEATPAHGASPATTGNIAVSSPVAR
ncbi:hypothetical protein ACFQ4K_12020 [Tistrella bauzanensis]